MLLVSMSLRALLAASLLLQQTGGGSEGTGADEKAGQEAAYPVVEKVEPAQKDPRPLLDALYGSMGWTELSDRALVGYVQEIWVWRGPKFAYYEKYIGKVDLREPRARIEDVSISPDTGRRQGVVFVVNHDDRFRIQGLQTFSSEIAELEATLELQDQMTLLLGPWWLDKQGVEWRYDGVAAIDTYDPARYDAPDKNGAGGWVDYQPTRLQCHKITALVPGRLRAALGDEVAVYLSTDEVPRLVQMKFVYPARNYAYGLDAPTFRYLEFQEVDDVQVPRDLDVTLPRDAQRLERIRFSRVLFGGELSDRELQRP